MQRVSHRRARLGLVPSLLLLPALLMADAKEVAKPEPPAATDTTPTIRKITLAEFDAMRADEDVVVLDVRTPQEFDAGYVPGAIHINWRARDFNQQVQKLDKSRKYVIYCLSGVRSASAVQRMSELGFTDLFNFAGGWSAYQKAGKPAARPGDTTKPPHAEPDRAKPKHKLIRPDHVQWMDAPPSLPPGAKAAILEGDPANDGYFALRLQLPDGYRIPPHWHPNVERVTVISGTFHLGTGDKFDPAAAEPLPAGSYAFMEPGMRHFARAEGATVIQITTIGPWAINYVNPGDDPRRK